MDTSCDPNERRRLAGSMTASPASTLAWPEPDKWPHGPASQPLPAPTPSTARLADGRPPGDRRLQFDHAGPGVLVGDVGIEVIMEHGVPSADVLPLVLMPALLSFAATNVGPAVAPEKRS